MFSTPSRQTSGEMDMSLGGGITMSLTNCFCIFAEAASTFYRVSYVCVCSQRQPRIAPSAVALDVRVAARVCLAEFRMSHLLMLVWSTHARTLVGKRAPHYCSQGRAKTSNGSWRGHVNMGVRRERQFVLFGVQLGEKHHRREKRRDAGHEERRKDTGEGRTCEPARRYTGALASGCALLSSRG